MEGGRLIGGRLIEVGLYIFVKLWGILSSKTMTISKFAFSLVFMPHFWSPLKTSDPLNSKLIPQSDSTTYLALIRRVQSIRIRCQASTVEWVERNDFFLGLAPRLLNLKLKYTKQSICDRNLARLMQFLQVAAASFR